MAIETHLAHSQQGTIVDFESNGERSVSRCLTRDSNARPRMALLIQFGANREGDQLKIFEVPRVEMPEELKQVLAEDQ